MRDRLVADRVASGRTSVLLLGPSLYVDLADQREFLSSAKDPRQAPT